MDAGYFGHLGSSCIVTQTCTTEITLFSPVGCWFKAVIYTSRMSSAWPQNLSYWWCCDCHTWMYLHDWCAPARLQRCVWCALVMFYLQGWSECQSKDKFEVKGSHFMILYFQRGSFARFFISWTSILMRKVWKAILWTPGEIQTNETNVFEFQTMNSSHRFWNI